MIIRYEELWDSRENFIISNSTEYFKNYKVKKEDRGHVRLYIEKELLKDEIDYFIRRINNISKTAYSIKILFVLDNKTVHIYLNKQVKLQNFEQLIKHSKSYRDLTDLEKIAFLSEFF